MSVWETIYKTAWILLCAIILMALIRLFYPKWQEFQRFETERNRLAEETRLQQEMIKALKIKQARFENDPVFVENIAHELGLVHADEIVFKFIDDPPADARED
jgi:hypothetical protein